MMQLEAMWPVRERAGWRLNVVGYGEAAPVRVDSAKQPHGDSLWTVAALAPILRGQSRPACPNCLRMVCVSGVRLNRLAGRII